MNSNKKVAPVFFANMHLSILLDEGQTAVYFHAQGTGACSVGFGFATTCKKLNQETWNNMRKNSIDQTASHL